MSLLALLFLGCSGPAVYTANNAPVSAIASEPTLAQVDKAVKDSLIGRGWIPQKVSAHNYIGTYKRRDLMAKVKISFDTQSFTVNHLDSRNLDYDSSDETIHPTYNKWIQNLENDIRKRVDRNVKIDKRNSLKKKVATKSYTATGGSFSEIQRGMSSKEVRSLIGEPDNVTRRVTKKAFNPFYFGSDRFRSTYYYKGRGRIEFNIKNRVEEIHNDTTESGN